jgi:hypothetical protein
MNNEDQFEQRLQRQPLRPVPGQWREEILATAEANRRHAAPQSVSDDQAALLAGWRLLFARLPIAWTALVALWVALIGVNLMLPHPPVNVAAQRSPAARMSLLAALDFKRAQLELLGEKFSLATEAPPASEAPAVPPRPRSERHRHSDFGEIYPDRLFNTVAESNGGNHDPSRFSSRV